MPPWLLPYRTRAHKERERERERSRGLSVKGCTSVANGISVVMAHASGCFCVDLLGKRATSHILASFCPSWEGVREKERRRERVKAVTHGRRKVRSIQQERHVITVHLWLLVCWIQCSSTLFSVSLVHFDDTSILIKWRQSRRGPNIPRSLFSCYTYHWTLIQERKEKKEQEEHPLPLQVSFASFAFPLSLTCTHSASCI